MKSDKNIPSGIFHGSTTAGLVIGANVFMFAYVHFSLKGSSLVKSLILYPGSILDGNYHTFITSGFIHSSWMHLMLNMFGVFIFSRIVERQLGVGKTLLIYFGALVLSMAFSTAVYSFILQKNIAIIGASGALMGMIGAAMLLDPFFITYEMLIPMPVMFKGWLFIFADIKGFLGGEQDGVSHLAHLCGFLSVAFLVYFLSREDKKQMMLGLIVNIVSFIIYLYVRNWGIEHSGQQ